MMIIDLSQISTAQLMVQTQAWKKHGQVEMNIDLIRHMILSKILQIVTSYRPEYGQVIIACDVGTSWRKAAYPQYKGARKAGRDKFVIDWSKFFTFLNEITEELKANFPYIVLNINHAEGDDVIGAVVRYYQANHMMEQILIVSGDKDFKQLHNDRTRQWSPILHKFVGTTDPVRELKEHIICGDRNDGVPNIKSPDNVFLDPDMRQTKMSKQRLAEYMEKDPKDYDPTAARNWARNELMVDLSKTPQRLTDQIITSLEEQLQNPTKNNVFNYLFKYHLKELQAAAGEF